MVPSPCILGMRFTDLERTKYQKKTSTAAPHGKIRE